MSPPNGALSRAADNDLERVEVSARLMRRREKFLLPQLLDFILQQ